MSNLFVAPFLKTVIYYRKLLDFQKQQASNLDIPDQTLDFIEGH